MTTAPLLALAAIVELRLTKWHKFSPFTRWVVGFLSGLVLLSLGNAAWTSLRILQQWDADGTVDEFRRNFTYWSIYFGIFGVILLPVSQLWSVVFADIRYLPQAWTMRRLLRQGERNVRISRKQIETMRRQRRYMSELIYKRILVHPEGVYTALGEGRYRVNVVDPYIKQLRTLAEEVDVTIADAEKQLREWVKVRSKQRKKYIKLFGSSTQNVTKVLTEYQGVWK